MYLHLWLLLPTLFLLTVHGDKKPNPRTSSDTGIKQAQIEERTPVANLLNGLPPNPSRLPKLSIKRRALPRGVDPYMWSVLETGQLSRPRSLQKPQHSGDKPLCGTPVEKRVNTFSIVPASQPTQADSVAVDQDGFDYSYFSELEFGSSGKTLYMLIDTGAANTWVMGSDCSSKACTNHDTFGNANSGSLQVTQMPFSLAYGSGNVSGVVVQDTVGFADLEVPLSFGSASETSDDFTTYPMDGILGLGRAKADTMDVLTFMEAVGEAKLLPANLFGVNLQRASDGSTNGEINFGVADDTKYSGDLSYTATVSDNMLWEIPIDDVIINGVPSQFKAKTAIIDTGTSFVLMPPVDAQQLHRQIPQSQQAGNSFNIPCSSTASVQVKISGVAYDISSKDYVGKPVSGGNLCSSNIIGRQTFGTNQWLLGDTFLKNVYSVFDFDNNQIGFGTKAPVILTESSSTPVSTTSAPSGFSSTASVPSAQTSNSLPFSRTPLSPELLASNITSVLSTSATALSDVTAASSSSASAMTPASSSRNESSPASRIKCRAGWPCTILASVLLLLYV